MSLGFAPGQPPSMKPTPSSSRCARDGAACRRRRGSALLLGAVAQRRVVDVEVARRSAGGVGHRRFPDGWCGVVLLVCRPPLDARVRTGCARDTKRPPGLREVCATRGTRRASSIMSEASGAAGLTCVTRSRVPARSARVQRPSRYVVSLSRFGGPDEMLQDLGHPVLVVRRTRRGRPAAMTSGWALATANEVPAHTIIGRSFGMSPNAQTSAAPTPRSAHHDSSAAALVTPARGDLGQAASHRNTPRCRGRRRPPPPGARNSSCGHRRVTARAASDQATVAGDDGSTDRVGRRSGAGSRTRPPARTRSCARPRTPRRAARAAGRR